LASPSFDSSAFLARLSRIALRVGFGLIAAVALVSLLIVSLGLLTLGLLRALITGQRPKPMMKFNFQSFSGGQGPVFWQRGQRAASPDIEAAEPSEANRPAAPRGRLGAQHGAVVDVEAREIPDRPPT
jgi:hypothetical protein